VKDTFGRGDHEGITNFARFITVVTKKFAVKCLFFFCCFICRKSRVLI